MKQSQIPPKRKRGAIGILAGTLLALLLSPLTWGTADEPAWVEHQGAGVKFQLPPAWMAQTEGPEGAMFGYGDPAGTGHSLLFSVALERDPGATLTLFRQQGLQVAEATPITLLGAAFQAWEINGLQGGNPLWVRQLVAPDAGADGRRLVVQYGVFGGDAAAAALVPFERILASLQALPPGNAPAAPSPQDGTATPAGQAAAAAPAAADSRQLAAALFAQILQKDDYDLAGIETLYRQVIEQCPATEQAEESYWRLSNMYLQAFEPPRKQDTIALLEQYRQRYPNSRMLDERFALFAEDFLPLVEHRLLQLYEEAEDWAKAEAIYATFLPDTSALTDPKLPFVLGRAKTLDKLGRPREAAEWYRLYVERSADPNDFLVGIAKAEMERLSAAAAATPAATTTTATASPAAQPAAGPPQDAAALLGQAKQAQAAGNYQEALEKYRASLALQPDPEVEKRIRKLEAYLSIVGGAAKGQ